LKGLLSLPAHPDATARSSTTAPSRTTAYDFATADYPGAAFSLAFGNNARTVVGAFVIAPGSSQASSFTFKRGVYRPWWCRTRRRASPRTSTAWINWSEPNAGCGGAVHGFLDVDGAFSNIDFPGAAHTQAIGLNDSTQVVGRIHRRQRRAWLPLQRRRLHRDRPSDALGTAATSINSAGDIVIFSL